LTGTETITGTKTFSAAQTTIGNSGGDSRTALSIVAEMVIGPNSANPTIRSLFASKSFVLESNGGTNKFSIALESGNITLADAATIAVGTSTGTKIGIATSQKLAFYNSTPIVQPSGNALTALSNLGLVASPTLAQSDITNLISDLAAKVAGRASATDNAIVRYDGTSGKLVQDSGVTISDGGAIVAGTSTGTEKSLYINHNTNGRTVDIVNNGTGYALSLSNPNTPTYNDNYIQLLLGDEKSHGHIAWMTKSDGMAAVQITAHELSSTGGVHDHMSIYTTNALDAPRNRFNLEFQRDYPDVQFQRIGTVQIWNGFLGSDEPDDELKNRNVSDNALEVVYSLRSTDGGAYTKAGYVASFRNQKSITSGTIADGATVMRIEQAGDTGEGISILNSSTGNAITITQTGDVGATATADGALYITIPPILGMD
jgi:hypothetical protein